MPLQSAPKRRKNAAHGASRGYRPKRRCEAPKGRKNQSHAPRNILLHFIKIRFPPVSPVPSVLNAFDFHSARSASIGFTDAARCAGK